MVERENVPIEICVPLKEGAINKIASINGKNPDEIVSKIIELVEDDPGIGKGEIYRQLTDGKGSPKSHMSGLREGDLKPGRIRARRKMRKKI